MGYVNDSSGRDGVGGGDDHEEISLEMVPQVPAEEEVEEAEVEEEVAAPGMSTEVDESGDPLTEEVGADL